MGSCLRRNDGEGGAGMTGGGAGMKGGFGYDGGELMAWAIEV